jgi:hypothetical protein
MKKILIFTLSLCLFSFCVLPVSAKPVLKQVEGTIPDLPPLQPPPPGFKVDSTTFFNGGEQSEEEATTTLPKISEGQEQQTSPFAQKNKSNFWVYIIAVFIVLASGFIYIAFRKKE